jgi:membrane fusion protein (multidrug efflux system)
MVQSGNDKTPADAPAPSPAGPPDRADHRSSSRRRRRVILLVGVVVLLVALAVGGIYYWRSTFYETTDDAYIDGDPVYVSARVAGNIMRVYVTDNQLVQADALLAEVDPCNYEISLAKAEAAVRSAQADADRGAADVEVARAQWAQQDQDLRRNEQLAKQGAITEQMLEHSRTATRTAEATLAAKEKDWAVLKAKTSQAKVDADQARLQLSYTKVRVPTAGYVTQRKVEEGMYVNIGQPLLAIVPEAMHVVANFKETQLTRMRPGQRVTVRVDTYPGVAFEAHVDSIQAGTGAAFSLFPPENATGNFVKVVQRVPVKIVFDQPPDPNHRLVLGMSVRPKVWIKEGSSSGGQGS